MGRGVRKGSQRKRRKPRSEGWVGVSWAKRGGMGCTNLRGQNLPGSEVGKGMASVGDLGESVWSGCRGRRAGMDQACPCGLDVVQPLK